MAEKVNAIPEGYRSITPYLVVKGASRALEYYSKVFGATEVMRMDGPEGKIAHAEFRIGDSMLMIADESPDQGFVGPAGLSGSPIGIMVYLEDVDSVARTAVENGATELSPVQDQFYGDRSGRFRDPFGHVWNISTHIEDVSPEEMDRRMAEMAKG